MRTQDPLPGLAQELLYMFLIGILYTSLLFLIEFGLISKIRTKLEKKSPAAFNIYAADEDVREEACRVQSLLAEGKEMPN